jgi:hypothetical protein
VNSSSERSKLHFPLCSQATKSPPLNPVEHHTQKALYHANAYEEQSDAANNLLLDHTVQLDQKALNGHIKKAWDHQKGYHEHANWLKDNNREKFVVFPVDLNNIYMRPLLEPVPSNPIEP